MLEQRATQLRLPLPTRVRPRTLSLSDGVAVVAAAGDPGVFAIRISDGAFALLGPNGGAFRPLLDARGVVFHDGESKRALREGQTIVKFVPRAGIEALLAQASAPVRTGGPIRALSFDGPRVALAVGDRRQLCDRVLYWNVAWPPVQQITARPGVTCLPGVRGIRISSLAIGGFHTAWLATSRATSRLVAGSPHCQEWVVRRFDPRPGGEQLIALAGDHATIAYAATTHEQGLRGMTSVGVVTGRWRPRQITSGLGTPRALAVSDHRVAVVWPDGRLELRTDGGRLLGQFGVGAARAVALEGSTLAVLRRGRLDLYDVRAAQRTRSLHVPISATSVDLQYGVAALAAGRSALVVDVPSGRLAVVGTAPERLVGVEIESYGLAYAWNSGHGGIAQLVPWTGIDATLA